MKTVALTLLLVSAVLAGCDTAPIGEGPTPDAGNPSPDECTLSPAAITQTADVTHAMAAEGTTCATSALPAVGSKVQITQGRIGGEPVSVTNLKSYASTAPGVKCVYAVSGYADVPVDASCSMVVSFATQVEIR